MKRILFVSAVLLCALARSWRKTLVIVLLCIVSWGLLGLVFYGGWIVAETILGAF